MDGRLTLTGLPPDARNSHTRGLPPEEPAAHRSSSRSQLTDVIDTPLIRIWRARADVVACGFAAADRDIVYSVAAPAEPPIPARYR